MGSRYASTLFAVRLTGATVSVVALAAGPFAQIYNTDGKQSTRMTLEAHILKETGVDPVDCGTHPIWNADPEALHRSLACGREATKQHQAFQTMQRGPSSDSETAYGVIGLRDGAILWFEYDSGIPCPSGPCGERFRVRRTTNKIMVVHEETGNHRLYPSQKLW